MWQVLDHGVEPAGDQIIYWAVGFSVLAIFVAVASYFWWRKQEAARLAS